MHINKGTQLDSKKTALENHLRRIAKIDHLPEVTVIDTKNDQWRNRIRLHAKVTKQILSTGLYKKNSTDIIAIDDCTICLEPINKWLRWLQANQHNLKLSDDTSFDLQLDLDEKGLNIWPQKIRANNKKSSTHKIAKKIEEFIKSSQNDFDLTISVADLGFKQSNQEINTQIQQIIGQAFEPSMRLLELYCGSGNLTSQLSQSAKEVIAVEQNFKKPDKKVPKMKFVNQPVEKFLAPLKSKYPPESKWDFDMVFLNPPRTGGKSIMPMLNKLELTQLGYLSCNSASLARDISTIMESQSGWQIEKIYLFDMFPETHHFETLITMKKSN